MLGPGYLQGKDGISNLVEQGSRFSFTPDFAIDAAPVELGMRYRFSINLPSSLFPSS